MGATTPFPASVFKAYDIRGTVPDLIDAGFARAGRGAGDTRPRGRHPDAGRGRDGRLSSEMLSTALQEGMLEQGIDTLDIGQVPRRWCISPRTHADRFGRGHHRQPQPAQVQRLQDDDGRPRLYGEDVQELARVMNGGAAPVAAHPGTRRQLDLVQAYVARVASGVKLARPMKIAIDCGNGVAAPWRRSCSAHSAAK